MDLQFMQQLLGIMISAAVGHRPEPLLSLCSQSPTRIFRTEIVLVTHGVDFF
jgi:hypothetical protein